MLGNSFTFYNDMPAMLADILGAEVVQHTRGGARLAEQLNPKTKMGEATKTSLETEKWDFLVLQEMSNGPITSRDKFFASVKKLCALARDHGAKPILYATWAYQRDGERLEEFGMDYDEMYRGMYEAYHTAAENNDALIADAGKAFYENADKIDLYDADGCHPNEAGSRLAAETIAEVIRQNS